MTIEDRRDDRTSSRTRWRRDTLSRLRDVETEQVAFRRGS